MPLVAIEDQRFYDHFGIDLTVPLGPWGQSPDGWTQYKEPVRSTQQLARNLYLNHERTWTRKLKEAIYALHWS